MGEVIHGSVISPLGSQVMNRLKACFHMKHVILVTGDIFQSDCNLVFHCVRDSRKPLDNWWMNRTEVVFSRSSASQHRHGEQWGGCVEVQDPWIEIVLLNMYFKVLTILYLYINLYDYIHTYCPLSSPPTSTKLLLSLWSLFFIFLALWKQSHLLCSGLQ